MIEWNYRVVKKDNEYGIYEVYYNKDKEPYMISEIELVNEDFDGLRGDYNIMSDAFGKPILDYNEIVQAT